MYRNYNYIIFNSTGRHHRLAVCSLENLIFLLGDFPGTVHENTSGKQGTGKQVLRPCPRFCGRSSRSASSDSAITEYLTLVVSRIALLDLSAS